MKTFLSVVLLLSFVACVWGESTPEQIGLKKTLAGINDQFKNVDVELVEWPAELHRKLPKFKKIAFMAYPVKRPSTKIPLLIALHGGGGRNKSVQE